MERRASHRYDIALEARITAKSRLIEFDCPAEIVSVSGCGALIMTDQNPPIGTPVRIRANWPAVRDGYRGAALIVLGKVVRVLTGSLAISVDRYEIHPLGPLGSRQHTATLFFSEQDN